MVDEGKDEAKIEEVLENKQKEVEKVIPGRMTFPNNSQNAQAAIKTICLLSLFLSLLNNVFVENSIC